MPTKPTAKASGPSYFDLIKGAIVALKDRTGSSRQAISKAVAAKKGTAFKSHVLNKALSSGVTAGKLVQVKGSYKLSAAEKKPPKKKAAPKKKRAAPKKKATKKKKKATKKRAAPKKKATKKRAAPKKKKATKKRAAPKKKAATKKKRHFSGQLVRFDCQ